MLASLYLGSGAPEQRLVADLAQSGAPQITVLLDGLRGSRGPNSSRDTLRPLLLLSGPQRDVAVHLYHTPDLRGLTKLLLPARYNEIVGLQHMKAYIFDDTLVLSGCAAGGAAGGGDRALPARTGLMLVWVVARISARCTSRIARIATGSSRSAAR